MKVKVRENPSLLLQSFAFNPLKIKMPVKSHYGLLTGITIYEKREGKGLLRGT
ncbi:hypothetical protein PORCRE_773 [Porphyromonas crevioricanis JCM 15906]|uniref:Uncharacterized protein n=1 Tax=Porphyromonas crevioricanis JCM 15906 TaxID=1305617 RepID=T1DR37_9PORP|nr:hypothetical protein PORCRE_773 [Porphyromonas crevioricanis JCM 15906]